RKTKAVFVDISGTLLVGNAALPGAIDALARLKQNYTVRLVTNTSKESQRAIYERLTTLGFAVEPSEVFTSLAATRALLLRDQRRCFFIIPPATEEDFADVPRDSPDTVVLGLAPDSFDYATLDTGFQILRQPDARLIAINTSRFYATPSGVHIAAGAFVRALEYAANVSAHVVGKPSAEFFRAAAASCHLDVESCVMIGDDTGDDFEGAMRAGLRAMLVATGRFDAARR
ncbi:uncharacterized protein MONBRDRAFT_13731, partial [Monosiga brevicollis MX1]